MVRIWGAVEERQKEHRVDSPREPDLGFAWAAFRWASGASLDAVLRDAEMQAGDFVRWTKQLIDLLGQLTVASRDPDGDAKSIAIGRTARAAADLLRRGVVAYSSVT
jgi:ATP-dependent RNA helicase HelY